MNEVNPAYSALGKRLKFARESKQQSLAEVSGAVEIDELTLARIEAGQERPSEDILLLLISHFEIQDSEAVRIWEMAAYGGELPDELKVDIDIAGASKVVMLIAQDMRSLYSDGVDVAVTAAGVNLSFTQSAGNNQVLPVAKVGMSIEQARVLLSSLQMALLRQQYAPSKRQLPPSTTA
jgi:transcriptional regulator with XRE-family HTH domain